MIKSILDDDEPDIKESKSGKTSPAKPTFNPPVETAADKEPQTTKPEDERKQADPPSAAAGKEVPDEKREAPRGFEPVSEGDLKKRLADIEAELETLQKLTPGVEAGGADSGSATVAKESEKKDQKAVETDAREQPARERSEEAGASASQSATPVEQVPDGPEQVPESAAETLRRSGMAYSAAIALFGSVIFMLILGWFADLLLGIKPWGTVIGITLGSIIGFFQFFRITSQIFKPRASELVTLLSVEPDAGDQTEVAELSPPGGTESPEVDTNTTESNSEGQVPVDDSPAVEGKRDNP